MLHLHPEATPDARPEAYAEAVSRLASVRHALRLVDPFAGGPASDIDDDAPLAAAWDEAGDEWLFWVHSRVVEQPPDFLRGLEGAVLIVERGEGQVARAWDVPGFDAWPRIGLAALEAAAPARVEQRLVISAEQLLLGRNL